MDVDLILIVIPILLLVGFGWMAWQLDSDSEKFRRELAERTPLDDIQFYKAFYVATDIPEHIPRRLRPIYANFFELDGRKLHPSDRPPCIVDFDTAPLVEAIESEFNVKITDADAENLDGSFDSTVRFLAASLKK